MDSEITVVVRHADGSITSHPVPVEDGATFALLKDGKQVGFPEQHYGLEVIVSPDMLVAPGITGIPSIDVRYQGELRAGQTIYIDQNEARYPQRLPMP